MLTPYGFSSSPILISLFTWWWLGEWEGHGFIAITLLIAKLLLSGPLYSCSWGEPCFLDPIKSIPSFCYQVLFSPVLEGSRASWTPSSSSQAASNRSSLVLFLRGAMLPGPHQVHPKLLLTGPLYSCSWGKPFYQDPIKSIPAAANRSSFLLFLRGAVPPGPHQVHPKLLLTGPLYSCSWGGGPIKFIPSCCYQVLYTPVLEEAHAAWTPSSSSQAAAIRSSFLLFFRGAVLPGTHAPSSSQAAANRSSLLLFLSGAVLSGPHQVHPKLLLSGPLYFCS